MTTNLDRDGIFRAVPHRWYLRESSDSKSIAIAIEYHVLEYLDQSVKPAVWQDWRGYDVNGAPISVDGFHYCVGKEGQPNQKTCDQLAESLGWDGSLETVMQSQPPKCLVQITVKSETYNGQSRRKVAWLAPGDSEGPGADPEAIKAVEASIGSLLRAAASSKRREPVPLPGEKPAGNAPPATAEATKTTDYDGVPF